MRVSTDTISPANWRCSALEGGPWHLPKQSNQAHARTGRPQADKPCHESTFSRGRRCARAPPCRPISRLTAQSSKIAVVEVPESRSACCGTCENAPPDPPAKRARKHFFRAKQKGGWHLTSTAHFSRGAALCGCGWVGLQLRQPAKPGLV